MDFIISDEALTEVREISAFIAEDNYLRSISFGDELLEQAADIANHPFRYAPLMGFPSYRKKTYKGYIILYTIREETVYIAHILNPRRDYSRLLK